MAAPELIDVRKAQALLAQGATLVDVREAGEQAVERIEGAASAPLSALAREPSLAGVKPGDVLIFYCKGGVRTVQNGGLLSQCAGGKAYVLKGGIEAWKAAGLPVRPG